MSNALLKWREIASINQKRRLLNKFQHVKLKHKIVKTYFKLW